MKLKILIISLVVILIFFQYQLWFAKNGLLENFHLKKAITVQIEKNNNFQHDNNNLISEIAQLRKQGSAIEKHARKDLGMIKQNEVFYRIVVNDK